MPLETSTTIEGLDTSWPISGDFINQGDDHLRLIKSVLQSQFPGAAGNGFAKAITATEDELNYLGGVTSNIQTQFNDLDTRITTLESVLTAEPGTVMPFYQDTAPLGWTKITTNNDFMMRIVSAGGGVSGGVDSPILNDKIPVHNHNASSTTESVTHTHSFSEVSTTESVTHTHFFSGTTNTTGAHVHNMGYNPNNASVSNGAKFVHNPADNRAQTGSAGDHSHTISGDTGNESASHTHTIAGDTSIESANHSHTITVDDNIGGSNWTPKYMNFIVASKD